MKRHLTEILHLKNAKSDKICILDLIQIGKSYCVMMYYGRRTVKKLFFKTVSVHNDIKDAFDLFDEVRKNKIDEGFRQVENGEHIDIPGFSAVLDYITVKFDRPEPDQDKIEIAIAEQERTIDI